MNLIKKLYVRINKTPYGTQKIEYDFKKFIIKKNDKVNYTTNKEYIKNINYIKRYGTIIEPVVVSETDFSNRYIIRKNIMGYYAMIDSHMKNVPVVVIQ